MSKSMYSLILNDRVMEAVDRLAMEKGLSRSEMITRILAEHLQMVTPEQKREVLGQMMIRSWSGEEGLILVSGRGGTVNLRGVLDYKYRPTLHYSIEILNTEQARLRVSLRSQNAALLMDFDSFARRFFPMEQSILGPTDYEIEPGRLTRLISLDPQCDDREQSNDIVRYVKLFDTCLRDYFTAADSPHAAYDRMKLRYMRYVMNGEQIMPIETRWNLLPPDGD